MIKLNSLFFAVSSLIVNCILPTSIEAAEKINFVYSSLSFPISVDSLEHFAQTGELKADLAQHTSALDAKTLSEIRIYLSKSFNFPQANLYKLSRTSLGQDLVKQLGKVISTHKNRNGFYAIRGAVLSVSAQQDSWTIIDVLRAFPTAEIFVNLELLAQLKDDIFIYQSYREAVARAIEQVAQKSAPQDRSQELSNLANLSLAGKYPVQKQTISLTQSQFRLTTEGFVGEYLFPVDFYLPQNQDQPLPLILISHGFGSVRENFTNLAQHLASHGFIVAVPEHVGSDLQYREELLKGTLSSALSPIEYLARPRDLSSVIDYLEQEPQWQNRINFAQIGVIGDSLGGTTALSIAGAPINIPRLQTECTSEQVIVNSALILQCQVSYLAPREYNLGDRRIKAVIATHPLTSAIFGFESLAQIKIPTMITAGSNDVITPVVIEQIHPFIWLKSPSKHLVFFQPGTHFSSTKPAPEFTADYLPQFLVGNNRDLSSEYFHGVAVAFMETYLKNNSQYLSYLSSSYGNLMSNENLQVRQISQLTVDDLTASYGNELPISVEPPLTLAFNLEDDSQSVIEEIKTTGILKFAYPQNALPFGYINQTNSQWQGFCSFLAYELASHLQTSLELELKPDIVFFPSSDKNRFDLVSSGQVHLECGPNKISGGITEPISFSAPFFVTGNQFLIKTSNIDKFNPNQSLNNSQIGVISDANHTVFLQAKYPNTESIFFPGVNDFDNALTALNSNRIQGILSDGIILESQLNQIENEQEYTLVPQRPLNCNYYGLILPKDDSQWNNLINNFLETSALTEIYFPPSINKNLVEQLDYCLNFNLDPSPDKLPTSD